MVAFKARDALLRALPCTQQLVYPAATQPLPSHLLTPDCSQHNTRRACVKLLCANYLSKTPHLPSHLVAGTLAFTIRNTLLDRPFFFIPGNLPGDYPAVTQPLCHAKWYPAKHDMQVTDRSTSEQPRCYPAKTFHLPSRLVALMVAVATRDEKSGWVTAGYLECLWVIPGLPPI